MGLGYDKMIHDGEYQELIKDISNKDVIYLKMMDGSITKFTNFGYNDWGIKRWSNLYDKIICDTLENGTRIITELLLEREAEVVTEWDWKEFIEWELIK